MRYQEMKEEEGTIWAYIELLATSLVSNSCNKSDELECDIASMYLLDKAGYDPEAALGGIDLLRRISAEKTGDWFETLVFAAFGSHPWSEDRVRCVKGYVRGSKVEVKCEEKFTKQRGKVITNSSPLNIRTYPIKKAEKIFPIPKGAEVEVLCDCVQQEHRPDRDWLYVEYFDGEIFHKGWVDKRYIEFL